jgi:hypothetical protein
MFPHFGRMTNTYINYQNKSEINTSIQKVDVIERAGLLSTVQPFTDL